MFLIVIPSVTSVCFEKRIFDISTLKCSTLACENTTNQRCFAIAQSNLCLINASTSWPLDQVKRFPTNPRSTFPIEFMKSFKSDHFLHTKRPLYFLTLSNTSLRSPIINQRPWISPIQLSRFSQNRLFSAVKGVLTLLTNSNPTRIDFTNSAMKKAIRSPNLVNWDVLYPQKCHISYIFYSLHNQAVRIFQFLTVLLYHSLVQFSFH